MRSSQAWAQAAHAREPHACPVPFPPSWHCIPRAWHAQPAQQSRMARSTHRHIARASDPSSLTSFAVTTVAVLHGCWRPRTLSLSPPQAAHFYSWGRCAYGSLRRARARYVCMRRVGPDGRGGVGRGRVACWASVATVAMCRHDPYSIYLMFAIVALSPDALECPGKYVYHRFGIFAQCDSNKE